MLNYFRKTLLGTVSILLFFIPLNAYSGVVNLSDIKDSELLSFTDFATLNDSEIFIVYERLLKSEFNLLSNHLKSEDAFFQNTSDYFENRKCQIYQTFFSVNKLEKKNLVKEKCLSIIEESKKNANELLNLLNKLKDQNIYDGLYSRIASDTDKRELAMANINRFRSFFEQKSQTLERLLISKKINYSELKIFSWQLKSIVIHANVQ